MALATQSVALGQPSAADAQFQTRTTTARNDDRASAWSHLSKAIQVSPNDPQFFWDRGTLFLKADPPALDKAIADFSEALRLKPAFVQALLDRAYAYEKKENLLAAMDDVNSAIQVAPKNALAYGLRAQIFRHDGKFELAIADYTRAIQLDPEFGSAYGGRASVYAIRHELEKARSDCGRAIQLAPKDPCPRCLMAQILLKQGDADAGLRELSVAISLAPNDTVAYRLRAKEYSVRGDFTKSIADYSVLIRLKPICEDYVARGVAIQAEGDADSAIADFSEALRLQPNSIEALICRGHSFQRRSLQQQQTPLDVFSNRRIGPGTLRDLERAVTDYTSALRLKPSWTRRDSCAPRPIFHLVQSRNRCGTSMKSYDWIRIVRTST